MAKSPSHGGEMEGFYLIFWRRNYPHATGTRPVAINEEKSRIVDLAQGEQFSFLGFDFRRVRSRQGAWRAWYPPRLKKRTALRRKLKEICRRYPSQPIERGI